MNESPMQRMARALEIKALLEDVSEYLHSNVPSDGWGILDRGADADRRALLVRVSGALSATESEPTESAGASCDNPFHKTSHESGGCYHVAHTSSPTHSRAGNIRPETPESSRAGKEGAEELVCVFCGIRRKVCQCVR